MTAVTVSYPDDKAWAIKVLELADELGLWPLPTHTQDATIREALELLGCAINGTAPDDTHKWELLAIRLKRLDPTMIADFRAAESLVIEHPEEIAAAKPRIRRLAAHIARLYQADVPKSDPEEGPR